jgi:uncharacterized membrane protein YjgN (DUF898 family)
MSDSGGGSGGHPPYPPQGWGAAPPPAHGPVEDHPRATTSLVLGILGFLLCQLLAPVAWVVGKRTKDEIDASGGRYGGRASAQAGYLLGVLGTVLVLLVLIVVAVVIIGALVLSGSISP